MAATVVATLVTPWRIKRSSGGGGGPKNQKPKPQPRHHHHLHGNHGGSQGFFGHTKGNWGGEVQEDDHTAKNMIIIIRI